MELHPIEDAIIIHPHLLQKFMAQGKEFANLLALYSFYLYHAKNQKTNQPLATDEFTKKGMNWAIDRVKKTKKLLKELEVIEVVQKRKYSYIHLFFIYTKNKIDAIFGKSKAQSDKKKENTEVKEKEVPKTPKKEKTLIELALIHNFVSPQRIEKIRAIVNPLFQHYGYKINLTALSKWLVYCEKKNITYGKTNMKNWLDKLNKQTSLEQKEAIFTAINKGWKDFYIEKRLDSPYHHLLGQSLMLDKECDTLLDIDYKEGKYYYIFKNLTMHSSVIPPKLFAEYGYQKEEIKKSPIVPSVLEKIKGAIRRF